MTPYRACVILEQFNFRNINMFSQFLANFSWLDVVVFLIIVHACWIGFKKGILTELFKMTGLVVAGVTAIHFFPRLSQEIIRFISLLEPVSAISSYIIIIVIGVVVFHLFREGIMVMFKEDEVKRVSRVAGAVGGFFRGLLLSGLILLGCLISDTVMLTQAVRHSFFSQHLVTINTVIYNQIYHFLIKSFFPDEPKNGALIKQAREYSRKPID